MSIPLRSARTAVAGLLLISALALGVVQAGAISPSAAPTPTGSVAESNGSAIVNVSNFQGAPIAYFYPAATACSTAATKPAIDPTYKVNLLSALITFPFTISLGYPVQAEFGSPVTPLPAGTYNLCLYTFDMGPPPTFDDVVTYVAGSVVNIYDPNAVPPQPEPTPDGGQVSPSFTG